MKKIKLFILIVLAFCSFGVAYCIVWDNVPGKPSFRIWQIEGNEANPVHLKRGHDTEMYIEAENNSTLGNFRIIIKMTVDGITFDYPLQPDPYLCFQDPWFMYDYGDILRIKFPINIHPSWPYEEGDIEIILDGGDEYIAAGKVHVKFVDEI